MISLRCEWSKQERSWDITIISSSNYDKLIYTNPLTEWQFKTHPNRIKCIDHLNVNSACQNNLKKGYFLFHKYLVYIYMTMMVDITLSHWPAICVPPLLCPVSSWNFEALVWRIPPTEKKCHTAVKMKIGVGVFCALHHHKSFFFFCYLFWLIW